MLKKVVFNVVIQFTSTQKGFGFKDRYGEPDQVLELLKFFQSDDQYSATLFGGVPTDWTDYNQEWSNVFSKFDIISPWMVGRYATGEQ